MSSVSCLSIFRLGGAALQFLWTINPPAFCLKSLAYSSIIANALLSLAPELSLLHECFAIPVLTLNSLSGLSCRSAIQTPVCVAQPAEAMFAEFPHPKLFVDCKLLTSVKLSVINSNSLSLPLGVQFMAASYDKLQFDYREIPKGLKHFKK